MYNHYTIEKKWQKYWLQEKTFKTNFNSNKAKYYVLDMFPYPSGSGLHVGHPEGYTATDIMARFKRFQNFEVLHPIGWDAFGLPAEQFALKNNKSPKEFTLKNITNFKRQIQELGFSYDWDLEINTTSEAYYFQTQNIFKKLYENNLAELKEVEVNWCPGLGTVLANEEIINENGQMVSERGSFPVVKKPMRQWVLKITKYADRLLADLDSLDWPHGVKELQRNWIGRSQGAIINFKSSDDDSLIIGVYTTRPDTIFGVSYLVLAPENKLVQELKIPQSHQAEIDQYISNTKSKSTLDRTNNKNKTGVFTGCFAISPFTNEKLPIWIADYVLNSYATGSVMAVPAHDERDYQFAQRYQLAIKPIIEAPKLPFTKDGAHINSDFLNGLKNQEAITKVIEQLCNTKSGSAKTNYKLHDWLFSRQRYWGEPFPIIHLDNGEVILTDNVKLPVLDNIQPSSDGQSPLANATDWLNVTVNGQSGKRETNTMPQWAGSCWYYLAYLVKNGEEYLDLEDPIAQARIAKWMPVDLYVGGAEHAVLHLLYARFWHKVLYDIGLVKNPEPFQRLYNQGMILGPDHQKMSKSKGNAINPDDIIKEYGADTLRLYEMFMGPLADAKPWSETGLAAAHKWIKRVYNLATDSAKISDHNDHQLDVIYHQSVKKISHDFEALAFNTAISQMMIFINACYKSKTIYRPYLENFLIMFSCIVPHVGEELWTLIGHSTTINDSRWPLWEERFLQSQTSVVIVQINSKVRAKLNVSVDNTQTEIETLAQAHPNVAKYLTDKTIVKVIYVAHKIINFIIK